MTYITRIAALLSTALIGAGTAALAQDDSQTGADIFVIGGKADDPFWSIVKRGAEDAGQIVEAQGGSVTWLGPQNYDNLGADAADLIRTAISQGADAIVGPNWVPESMDEAFAAVVEADIPLILYNAGGLEAADRLGALNYIGSDDFLAGKAAGEYFAQAGVTNVVCVNTLPGAANLQAQCAGLAEGVTAAGGTAEELPLPMTSFGNPTAVSQAVKAHLLQNPDVTGLYTIGNVDANSASIAITQAGAAGRVQLGGFNMDQTILDNISSGAQLFAIDQQGYLQGFLAVSLLNNHVNYGLTVPTRQILTGPGIVDASNVEATLAGVQSGTR
ncbi:sugar ABC transporter substrate-binding protein [Rubellimicrobium rubrum]|uniref:Sugar ABC transporter substrate-binding protein n=1 Tax=Rubellimicrobium rubrum TaxID=2585369 RepID=A0A5C4MQY6_9RHOB|nr:sugar ABC transporter substrate-binding protein [Rubellimicrobium rubrum]TNC46481.1 sugar ABC transporter substrate-binding protein [Rubellimicrobium rubrum]